MLPLAADEELLDLTRRMCQTLDAITPRPARDPNERVSLVSPEGLDEAAMRMASLLVDGEAEHAEYPPDDFYRQLAWDLNFEETPDHVLPHWKERLRPTLESIMRSYDMGLFDLRPVNVDSEIEEYAEREGLGMEDESIVAIFRMYDDIRANQALGLRNYEDLNAGEIREYYERGQSIAATGLRILRELDNGTFPMLAQTLALYMVERPDWTSDEG